MPAVFAANLPFMPARGRGVAGVRCGFGPFRDDRGSERPWRRGAAAHAAGVGTEDQWYEYDGRYLVGGFQRGTLSGSDPNFSGITTVNQNQDWIYESVLVVLENTWPHSICAANRKIEGVPMKRVHFLIVFLIVVIASCRSTRSPESLSEEQRSEVNSFTQGFRELCNDRADVISQLRIESAPSDAYYQALGKSNALGWREKDLSLKAFQISQFLPNAEARVLADRLRNECYVDMSANKILKTLMSEN